MRNQKSPILYCEPCFRRKSRVKVRFGRQDVEEAKIGPLQEVLAKGRKRQECHKPASAGGGGFKTAQAWRKETKKASLRGEADMIGPWGAGEKGQSKTS